MCSDHVNGVNVIWRSECSEDLPIFRNDYAEISWPLSEMVFRFTLEEKGGFTSLKIQTIDEYSEFIILDGTVTVYRETVSVFSKKFSSFNFNGKSYKSFEFFSFPRDELSNGFFTLFIQLWKPPEKNIIATYYVDSKIDREKYIFEWKLDTQINKCNCEIDKIPFHSFIKKVPNKFRTFNKNKKNDPKLTIELNIQSFTNSNGIGTVRIYSNFNIIGKLKFDAINKNKDTLNIMDTNFIQRRVQIISREKMLELIANKHLFYPHQYLTLNVSIETFFYSEAEIIEVDYLSDTQNITGIIEKSNKLSQKLNEENSSSETLSTSMYALYKNGQFCNVTLGVGKEKFLCHKSVLCARSPVFRAMFENDMKEKESNFIQIQDMNAHSFGIFLNTLYTDSLLDVEWDDVLKVYEAADKYDVSEIRKLCTKFLLSELSMRNVCQILELSNTHQDDGLMGVMKEFFVNHAKEIIKLPDWNDFMSRNLSFAAKLMQEYIST